MAFEFNISPGSGIAIFRQIADQVRLAVMTSRLAPGHQLPSVRALAEQLVINPNTVAKAYGELSRLGIIETQAGKGVFVAPLRQIYTKAERLRRIAPLVEALVNEGISLGFEPGELADALQNRLDKLDTGHSSRRDS